MTTLIIFLDIDGVLIAYPEGKPTLLNFAQHSVEVLQSILTAIPDLLDLASAEPSSSKRTAPLGDDPALYPNQGR